MFGTFELLAAVAHWFVSSWLSESVHDQLLGWNTHTCHSLVSVGLSTKNLLLWNWNDLDLSSTWHYHWVTFLLVCIVGGSATAGVDTCTDSRGCVYPARCKNLASRNTIILRWHTVDTWQPVNESKSSLVLLSVFIGFVSRLIHTGAY